MMNEQAITDATTRFYDALGSLFTGDAQPMKDAWSHTDDVYYMGPDGLYLTGWEKVGQMWDDVASMKLGGHVTPKQLHSVIGSDMAVITCVESGVNEVNGKSEEVRIRSSTVFHKRNDVWKVVGHQTDLLGYMN